MNTLQAFMMGEKSRGNKSRVFDWNKAARTIVENNWRNVGAGLQGDWEWIGGTIFEDGKIVTDDYTYLSSTWAIPEICNYDTGEYFDCFLYEDETEWDGGTKWPQSAVDILDNHSLKDY